MGGIQAQYAPSMYIGLWSRLKAFTRADLTTALETKAVVQGTLMRSTIHLVSAADYWPFVKAIERPRRDWWVRVQRGFDAKRAEKAATDVAELLSSGPRHIKEIEELVGKETARGVGLFVDLVRAPPSGTWERRRADLYATAETWLGPPPQLSEADAVDHIVTRYLTGFGPAAAADIATWAGIPASSVSQALSRLHLVRYRTEGGQELVDLAGLPIVESKAAPPPRFLPTWDALLLVHARRSRVLPEEHRPRIFNTKMPQSMPTYTVAGQVAGTWTDRDGAVTLQPFVEVSARQQRLLASEAGRLGSFLV